MQSKDDAILMAVPKIVKYPANVSAVTGDKVTLECEATGLPPPKFTWTHQGKSLDEVKTVKVKSCYC